ncbi:glycosyltransferase [candidate division KSB1 bacterium]|nr:glycosyltransferase [candidate division KSB1 bacterium]
MKVALIHDWLTGMRGGEKCLEVFCELFPDATVMTLLHLKGTVSPVIENMAIQTSFIQRLPALERKYRHYLPLFPAAIEQFDLRGYDLVLSSSHCVAKGVIPHPGTLHLCYCHTPMRYVWSMYQEYFGSRRIRGIQRYLIAIFSNYLRTWDITSNHRVHHFIANSEHVRKRIEHYYQRQADVIHPPVDTSVTTLSTRDDGYFLIVSALVPYKRIDLAVQAFNQLDEKLIIVGQGSEERALKASAKGNIEFTGWVNNETLRQYYAGCRALIFPGEEDFGIVPIEAQAYGKPIIAYGRGGALETVKGLAPDRESGEKNTEFSGIFFARQTVEHLIGAIETFGKTTFDPQYIRSHALKFDRSIFKEKIKRAIVEKMNEFKSASQNQEH